MIDTQRFLPTVIPIIYGYKHGIPPEIIGNINNLWFISALENHKKSKKEIKLKIDDLSPIIKKSMKSKINNILL